MSKSLKNTSTFTALRNPIFRKLWFAGVLSGTCVAAHDCAATWVTVIIAGPKVLDFYAGFCAHRATCLKADGKDIKVLNLILSGDSDGVSNKWFCRAAAV